MSDSQDDQSGDATEGQDQGGQPQGGQPTGGQPQGGQPQGGPQGGQYQGQAPPQQYNAGPGIGDIFSRPETLSEMKIGVVVFAGVGVGLGIAGFGLSLSAGGGGGGLLGISMLLVGALLFSPLIAAFIGLRQSRILEDQPDSFVYANAGVTGFAGSLVVFVIGLLFFAIFGGPGAGSAVGQMIAPGIVAAIGAGVTGAIAAWAPINLVPRYGPPAGQQAQAPGQTR